MRSRLFLLRMTLVIAAGFFIAACGDTNITNPTNITINTGDTTKHMPIPVDTTSQVVPITGVSVDSTAITRTYGAGCQTTYQLVARVLPANAVQTVVWSVTNHGAGSITSGGLMSILKVGTDTVFATSTDSTKKALIVVTVVAGTCGSTSGGGITISINPDHGSGNKGTTLQVTATVTGTTNKAVIWYSTGPNVVAVAQKDGDAITVNGQILFANVKGGTLYFAQPGTVQICAQSVADPTKRACGAFTTNVSMIMNLVIPSDLFNLFKSPS